MRRLPAVLGLAVVAVVGTAVPASAHVIASPATAAPKTFVTITLQVPNERANDVTQGLDVKLPQGFELEDAQQIPGWTTQVVDDKTGLPTEIRWSGGAIPPHTFGVFSFRGRTPARTGKLTFPAVQHYRHDIVNWDAPGGDEPAPNVVVARAAAAAATGPSIAASPQATVPLAPTTASQPSDGDAVARSRSALALVIAVAGVLLALGLAGFGTIRRRLLGGDDGPGTGAADDAPAKQPASGSAGAAPEPAKQRKDGQPPAQRKRSGEKARA